MSTLREFLNDSEFDWTTGRIIVQQCEGDAQYPGWRRMVLAAFIQDDDPVLDKEFDAGYGGPECPRYIAEDANAIYFPDQYDGATSGVRVWKDVTRYLNEDSPYPGG